MSKRCCDLVKPIDSISSQFQITIKSRFPLSKNVKSYNKACFLGYNRNTQSSKYFCAKNYSNYAMLGVTIFGTLWKLRRIRKPLDTKWNCVRYNYEPIRERGRKEECFPGDSSAPVKILLTFHMMQLRSNFHWKLTRHSSTRFLLSGQFLRKNTIIRSSLYLRRKNGILIYLITNNYFSKLYNSYLNVKTKSIS